LIPRAAELFLGGAMTAADETGRPGQSRLSASLAQITSIAAAVSSGCNVG
jgi:hypothetical protein